jgi:hypothetical protein
MTRKTMIYAGLGESTRAPNPLSVAVVRGNRRAATRSTWVPHVQVGGRSSGLEDNREGPPVDAAAAPSRSVPIGERPR